MKFREKQLLIKCSQIMNLSWAKSKTYIHMYSFVWMHLICLLPTLEVISSFVLKSKNKKKEIEKKRFEDSNMNKGWKKYLTFSFLWSLLEWVEANDGGVWYESVVHSSEQECIDNQGGHRERFTKPKSRTKLLSFHS